MSRLSELLSKLPSIVWVIIFPLSLILFIGSIIVTFYALANVEGFASLIMLIVPILMIKFTKSPSVQLLPMAPADNKWSSLFLAGGIVFYALMGMSIDQPGNFIYNKPLELFCPEQTSLERYVEYLYPLPGRTDIIQNYACVDSAGTQVDEVAVEEVLLVRFVEYVIIGYAIIFASKALTMLKLRKDHHSEKVNL